MHICGACLSRVNASGVGACPASEGIKDPLTSAAVCPSEPVALPTVFVAEPTVLPTVFVAEPAVLPTVFVAEPTVLPTVFVVEPAVLPTVFVVEPTVLLTVSVAEPTELSTASDVDVAVSVADPTASPIGLSAMATGEANNQSARTPGSKRRSTRSGRIRRC